MTSLRPLGLMLLCLSLNLAQQPPPPAANPEASGSAAKDPAPKEKEKEKEKEDAPIKTPHTIVLNGKKLNYTATVGMMPIKTDAGELEAHMFYTSYTLDQPAGAAARPLTIAFNGGPGSASVWLHLGCIGPKRVKLNDDGSLPAPPYQLADNTATWLDMTDLVFIDPVGTGFSRPVKPELGKKFFGLNGDISSVGEFIRLFLTRYQRWSSPLFLAGESYGTTRAAGLSGYLIEKGIAFNGIVLLSTVLNFQTLLFTKGNDLPYEVILPSYTATAWYHKKLAPELQADLAAALKESEAFALGEYATALARGDSLPAAERAAIITKLARLTGLSEHYITLSDLRVEIQHFVKELLRDERTNVGRLDSRLTAPAQLATSEFSEFDPALATIRPPYTAAFNQYVRKDLGYESDLTYLVLGGGLTGWDWNVNNGFADTSDSLRSAFSKNPHMRLFIGSGYFDLATPYFAAIYTMDHAGLPPAARKNVATGYYRAGHMFYIDLASLSQFRKDVGAFYEATIRAKP